MKTILIVLVAVGLSGCAQLQRITSSDGMSNEERIAYQKKKDKKAADLKAKQEEDARIAAAQDAIKPGSSRDDLLSSWGRPDSTEYYDGKEVLRYNNEGSPIDFTLKDSVVLGYKYDRGSESMSQTAQTHREIAEQHERNENKRSKKMVDAVNEGNWVNAINGMGKKSN